MTCSIIRSDAIDFFNAQEEDSIDLVLGSPPYMDARTYVDGKHLVSEARDCQEWVDWMLAVSAAAVRVCKGLVLWVVSGVQRDKNYWPGCEGLMWEWWKRGNHLWRPCIWHKIDADGGGTGIPGSGGKQWLRNDWEYVIAFKKAGWLPWADNTAMGHPPVIDQVGGAMSNRTVDGRRINEAAHAQGKRPWTDDPWKTKTRGGSGCGGRRKNGKMIRGSGSTRRSNGEYKHVARMDVTAGHNGDGTLKPNGSKPMPKIANPGNVIRARVGGGHMGDRLCHENEAPYPEALAEFFILSFCKPGGIVSDCFSGSGTTAAMSVKHGRKFIGCDLRESQVKLGLRRVAKVTPLELFA